MLWIGRIAGFLVFLFSLAMGLMTLADPARMGEVLGLTSLTEMGRNTVRADISAFFLASAIACGGGLFTGRSNWFFAAALLYGMAVSGRLIDALIAGAPDRLAGSVVIKLVLVVLAIVAGRFTARAS